MTTTRQKVLDGTTGKPINETLITRGELHALRLAELLISEAVEGCEHCRELVQKIQQHWCERCGADTDRLKLNSRYGSDFQLCERCYKYD